MKDFSLRRRVRQLSLCLALSLYAIGGCSPAAEPAPVAPPTDVVLHQDVEASPDGLADIDAGAAQDAASLADGAGDGGSLATDTTGPGSADGVLEVSLGDGASGDDAPSDASEGDAETADISALPDAVPQLDALGDGVGDGSSSDAGTTGSADSQATDGAATDSGAADTQADASDAAGPMTWAAVAAKCDAGDEVFARRLLASVAGRKPRGVAELRVLTAMTKAIGRKKMVSVLLSLPEARERWAAWIQDELRVSRAGYRQHKQCFAAGNLSGPPNGKLCAWVRDNASTSNYGTKWNMNDLLASCLVLDDLSPVYRAYLFAMLGRPTTQCCNPTITELDKMIRADFGRIVRETYLHRDIACVGCHNSKYAVTDDVDPQLDRHWPIPGLFEKAIFGQNGVSSSSSLDPPFRYFGVATGGFCITSSVCSVLKGGQQQPWGMSTECGAFQSPNNVQTDPFKTPAFFTKNLGTDSSVWEIESLLFAGLTKLRQQGKVIVDPKTLNIESTQAFAYQWAIRVAHQAWTQVIGHPLTITHGFSRNAAQLDILDTLAKTFVAQKFSLRVLLEEIVTHPLFNLSSPQAGCAASPYPFSPVLNAFATNVQDKQMQLNGPGDRVRRYSPRIVLSMVEHALGWPATPAYGSMKESEFQAAIGMFMEENVPGFRGVDFGSLLQWESRLGTCQQPKRYPVGKGAMKSLNNHSCVDRCNNNDTVEGPSCGCTAACQFMGNCCKDYATACASANVALPNPKDWIDALMTTVKSDPTATIGDVATALKDRLLAQPGWMKGEEAAVAAFFGVANLSVKAATLSDLKTKTRHFCGVLLKTPQFTLDGPVQVAPKISPKFVAKKDTLKTLCEEWAGNAVVKVSAVLTCQTNALTVKAKP